MGAFPLKKLTAPLSKSFWCLCSKNFIKAWHNFFLKQLSLLQTQVTFLWPGALHAWTCIQFLLYGQEPRTTPVMLLVYTFMTHVQHTHIHVLCTCTHKHSLYMYMYMYNLSHSLFSEGRSPWWCGQWWEEGEGLLLDRGSWSPLDQDHQTRTPQEPVVVIA